MIFVFLQIETYVLSQNIDVNKLNFKKNDIVHIILKRSPFIQIIYN